ncbi:MAG: hypothetical protein IPM55_19810 [Acidobacteria bacterium]|nr:hypothetical protein [Acidobacteriota bacterium]
MRSPVIRFIRDNYVDVIFFIAEAALALGLPFLIALLFSKKDPYILGLNAFGLTVITFFIIILFNQRVVLDKKIQPIYNLLSARFGHHSYDDQYFLRTNHYTKEKELLAEQLAQHVLPKVIGDLYNKNSNLRVINIIIDSGSTLTPLFPELISEGIQLNNIRYTEDMIKMEGKVDIFIYTNSESGIDEIHRIPSIKSLKLTERHFNLIGGQPLRKYRANTGRLTQMFLDSLWKEKKENKDTVCTISIITANWFTVKRNCTEIALLARGHGHMDFKKSVCENSDIILLVAPLGKILPINNVKILNDILKKYESDTYQDYVIPCDRKNMTYLITTQRPINVLYPLYRISRELTKEIKDTEGLNYMVYKSCKLFVPQGKMHDEIFLNDVPHHYIRENFEEIYGYSPK